MQEITGVPVTDETMAEMFASNLAWYAVRVDEKTLMSLDYEYKLVYQ